MRRCVIIELYCRTYTTPYSSGEWHDVALYVGENREEAQAAFDEHIWGENEVGIWSETGLDIYSRNLYTKDMSGYALLRPMEKLCCILSQSIYSQIRSPFRPAASTTRIVSSGSGSDWGWMRR